MLFYSNKNTIVANVGDVKIGGDHPLVIQSMCNTPPENPLQGFEQAKQLALAGAQLVRFTVRNKSDVEVIRIIKNKLRSENIFTPLVADVHFNPNIALMAAEIVEKVRINPGNFLWKRANVENPKQYSEDEWELELQQIEEKFIPLLNLCKKNNTALRIGVNHGSLSERIMSRYGNTPEGMVESAMEFLRLCQKHSFFNVVVSIKSSNVRIMVTTCRMLAQSLAAENIPVPMHLGVTEAGNELAGRVRSAVGIGVLLFDGIGNTIRVSLTEDPVNEIPAAKKLANYCASASRSKDTLEINTFDIHNFSIYKSLAVDIFGGKNPPSVILDIRHEKKLTLELLQRLGYTKEGTQWNVAPTAPDAIFVENITIECELPPSLKLLFDLQQSRPPHGEAIPVVNRNLYLDIYSKILTIPKMIELQYSDLTNNEIVTKIQSDPKAIIILDTFAADGFHEQRKTVLKLLELNISNPVILRRHYSSDDLETYTLQASADVGGLMLNGLGNGIWLTNPFVTDYEFQRSLMFEILQASRSRISQAEYIACPSCGRTQFEIEKVLAEIKKRTKHLTHLKIGVMGCIVNGPGEMADADYGYVGAAPGKVMLYKGTTIVRKNIPAEDAVDELIQLIKKHGDWKDQ